MIINTRVFINLLIKYIEHILCQARIDTAEKKTVQNKKLLLYSGSNRHSFRKYTDVHIAKVTNGRSRY